MSALRLPATARVFISRRMAVVTLLGFSSGMPLALTSSTLQTWMRREDVDLATIGIFSLVGLPYALKFFWAPLMDRFVPPFFGRRRGWMLLTQFGLVLATAGMGLVHPTRAPLLLAVLALTVAFLSASQDIVIDAYNIEILDPIERGAGSSVYVLGYRVAMLASGGGSLILAQYLSWGAVYGVMACVMALGVLTTLWAPEPAVRQPPPTQLKAVVVESFREFLGRSGAWEVLAFLVLYRLGANLAIALNSAFFVDLGFSNLDIGTVMKGFGTFATIAGTFLGGALMVRLGLRRSLLWFGILQTVASVAYFTLAQLGHSYGAMVASIALEYGFSGPAIAAFQAFMMGLCDRRFTATQFALITSFMALSRYVASAPSGFLAQHLGWPGYFALCVAAGLPAVAIIWGRYSRWVFPATT